MPTDVRRTRSVVDPNARREAAADRVVENRAGTRDAGATERGVCPRGNFVEDIVGSEEELPRPVATAASIQLAAAIPNFDILEYAIPAEEYMTVVKYSPEQEDGYFLLLA
ncbi:MAG: hypothetical protein ACWGPN_14160, partial [Gammaproteobacteria bacterium]